MWSSAFLTNSMEAGTMRFSALLIHHLTPWQWENWFLTNWHMLITSKWIFLSYLTAQIMARIIDSSPWGSTLQTLYRGLENFRGLKTLVMILWESQCQKFYRHQILNLQYILLSRDLKMDWINRSHFPPIWTHFVASAQLFGDGIIYGVPNIR